MSSHNQETNEKLGIGLSQKCDSYSPAAIGTVVDRARAGGLNCAEIRLSDKAIADLQAPVADDDASYNLGGFVHSLGVTYCPVDLDSTTNFLRRLIQLGERMGATALNLRFEWTAQIPRETSDQTSNTQLSVGETLDIVDQSLRALRLDTERADLRLLLDARGDGLIQSPILLRQIIDSFSAWPYGACVDASRLVAQDDPFEWLGLLRQRVHCVRLGSLDPAEAERLSTILSDIQYQGPLLCGDLDSAASARQIKIV